MGADERSRLVFRPRPASMLDKAPENVLCPTPVTFLPGDRHDRRNQERRRL